MKKILNILCLSAMLIAVWGVSASPIIEIEGNDGFTSAQIVPGSSFESGFSAFNSNIFNSLSVPHATVNGNLSQSTDVDFYHFAVGSVNSTGYFDIDQTTNNLDTLLTLFDSSGNVLAIGDDNCIGACLDASGSIDSSQNDLGSSSIKDAFIGVFQFTAVGDYFLSVSSSPSFPSPVGDLVGSLTRPDLKYGGEQYLPTAGVAGFPISGSTSGDYVLTFLWRHLLKRAGSRNHLFCC